MVKANNPSETLRFRPRGHSYHLGDRELVSVTTILKDSGAIDDWWYTDEARLRGTTVAIATKLYDEGDLDLSKLSGEFVGYVQAWEAFKAATNFQITAIEYQVCNEAMGIAGRLDRIGHFAPTVEPWIIEIKTGEHEEWHWLQLAGYAWCYPRPAYVGLVYLRPDSTYRVKRREFMQTLEDRNRFAALAAVARIRKDNPE